MSDKHCEYILENGQKCKGYKIRSSNFCFVHTDTPEVVAMREKALKKAAESHKLYFPITTEGTEVGPKLPKFVDLHKSKGIKKAYIAIIKAAAQGAIDEKRLGALTYALNGYVNAIDKIEILQRIEALEKKVAVHRSRDE